MDNLMSEATDLILSSKQNPTSDPIKAVQWRSRTSRGPAELSSITLLRLSITESLKDRGSKSEVVDINTLQHKKRRRRRGSSSGKPKIDVQLLNSENVTYCTDNTDLAASENSNTNSVEDSSKSDVPEDSLTKLFTEVSDSDETDKPEAKQTENGEDEILHKNKNSAKYSESPAQKDIANNGLKLARRNFSDSIFENCSTYSLSCQEVLQAENSGDLTDSIPSDGGDSWSSGDSISPKSGFSVPYLSKSKENVNADKDNNSDDQVSLSDSFFVRVNSEDNSSRSSIFSKESDYSSISRMSSRLSFSKENDLPEEFAGQASEKQNQKSERRLSKKWRKKHKKSKSNDVPSYECPKCGVSYILSNKTSMSTARCLHCDFWKSVEPVFLKREKQPWNTCLIC